MRAKSRPSTWCWLKTAILTLGLRVMVPLVGSRDPEISPSRVDFPMPAERSNIALDVTTQKLQNDVPLVPMLQSQHDQF